MSQGWGLNYKEERLRTTGYGIYYRNKYDRQTHHGWHAKDVAEMRATGVVLGDVGEMREIVGVLAGAVNVANFVLANRLLSIPIIPNTNVANRIAVQR